jgi:hypothetical protein
MAFTTLQSTPIQINLLQQGKSTGWAFIGTKLTHEVCNFGDAYLNDYPLESGKVYEFSYNLNSISGGLLRAYAGNTTGATITTTGNKKETLTATGTNPKFKFYSTANLEMESFTIREVSVDTSLKKKGAIALSEKTNKWTDFRTFNPDVAFSMFTKTYMFKQGNSYVNDPESESRNNFFGAQYKTIIKFVANILPAETKTFDAIEYKANTLLITTTDGITTSLGQVSDLVEADFLQHTLNDGITAVQVYDREGNYQAGFLRDKNEDINNGSLLKGHYAVIELITTENSVLKLFMVEVKSNRSYS